ncbi:unnamed protein product [Effrenium voratum]|nr:unnamed protein product [Effrenium voratum]
MASPVASPQVPTPPVSPAVGATPWASYQPPARRREASMPPLTRSFTAEREGDVVHELLNQGPRRRAHADGTMDGLYVDCSGGLGHSRRILPRLSVTARLVVFVDNTVLPEARALAEQDPRLRIAQRPMEQLAEEVGHEEVDGVLIDRSGPGPQRLDIFADVELDLRVSPEVGVPAWRWLQEASTEEIAWVLREYGEHGDPLMSERIAEHIKHTQSLRPIRSNKELACVVGVAKQNGDERAVWPTFHALMVFLNQEMEQLDAMLHAACEQLAHQGRCVVITSKDKEGRAVVRFVREHEEPEVGGRWPNQSRVLELYPLVGTDSRFCVIMSRSPFQTTEADFRENRPRRSKVHVLEKRKRLHPQVSETFVRPSEQRFITPSYKPVFMGADKAPGVYANGWLPTAGPLPQEQREAAFPPPRPSEPYGPEQVPQAPQPQAPQAPAFLTRPENPAAFPAVKAAAQPAEKAPPLPAEAAFPRVPAPGTAFPHVPPPEKAFPKIPPAKAFPKPSAETGPPAMKAFPQTSLPQEPSSQVPQAWPAVEIPQQLPPAKAFPKPSAETASPAVQSVSSNTSTRGGFPPSQGDSPAAATGEGIPQAFSRDSLGSSAGEGIPQAFSRDSIANSESVSSNTTGGRFPPSQGDSPAAATGEGIPEAFGRGSLGSSAGEGIPQAFSRDSIADSESVSSNTSPRGRFPPSQGDSPAAATGEGIPEAFGRGSLGSSAGEGIPQAFSRDSIADSESVSSNTSPRGRFPPSQGDSPAAATGKSIGRDSPNRASGAGGSAAVAAEGARTSTKEGTSCTADGEQESLQ